MIKLSISNIAWSEENDTEMYQFLRKTGYRGLEIAPTRIFQDNPYERLSEARDFAEVLKEKYSLLIPSMQSIWYGRSEKIFGSNEERKILVDYTKRAIDFAEVIGCKNLVFGNPRNRDTENVLGNYPVAIDFFREIGDYALEHSTIIAIEANPVIYNTHFLNTTEQAVEMAYKSCSDGVKVNVDLGTILYNKEDIEYLKKIPEYINHVHISEPWLSQIEHRNEHMLLFGVLESIGYDRFVSIEMGNKGNLINVQETINYVKLLSRCGKN